MTDKPSLFEGVEKFSNSTILCVGDVMMDRFIYGSVERVSPEGPIPVLLVENEKHMLGGVGNVVSNIASLGANTILVGVIGDDIYGRDIEHQLEKLGIKSALEECNSRSTTVKTRYVGGNQQIIRVDREKSGDIPKIIEDKIIKNIEDNISKVGALILSDYGKGVLTDRVVTSAIQIAKEYDVPVFVDPKGKDFTRYAGASFVTPNSKELNEATGMPTKTDENIEAAARHIMQENAIENVLATRSEDGMSIVSLDGETSHIKTKAKEVFDVSGAGDTVIATFATGVASGLAAEDAANIANIAAGIVVGKHGTATVSKAELIRALSEKRFADRYSKLLSIEAAAVEVALLKQQGKKVGFANGCFDLPHPGHHALLRAAKLKCDFLVAAINSDRAVKELKGEDRPFYNQGMRADMLSSLEMIDMVVIFDEKDVLSTIEAIKPNIVVKGGDYKKEEVQGYGIVDDVVIVPLEEDYSTTNTIAKLRA